MLVIKLAAAVILAANAALILPALATSESSDRALVVEAKESYQDNMTDIDDDAIYYASEQYKIAKHANAVLRDIRMDAK